MDALFNRVERLYAASLSVILKRKWWSAVVVIGVVAVFVVSMGPSGGEA
ncbi:MAG: hypothetical protein LBE74_02945 [Treponema sp.]|jgi:multidrug efflux pump subunit AcrB|nr:hypothetical protein [Treponema sp.]